MAEAVSTDAASGAAAKESKGKHKAPKIELSGAQKAAAVIVALGAEKASLLYKYMEPDDVEQITLEVARLGYLDSEVTEDVLTEFYQMCMTNKAVTEGGLEYARTVLEKAYGEQAAEDLLDLPQHRRIAERIYSIVPKSSVVGMLLEHEEDYTVVDSDQLGFLQHDGFSWQVMGDHFVTLHQVSRQAHLSDQELRKWVHEMPVEQRAKFVDALFSVLGATGAVTLTDLKTDSLKATGAMAKAMAELDKETRDGLLRFLGILFKSNLRMVLEGIQEEKKPLQQ